MAVSRRDRVPMNGRRSTRESIAALVVVLAFGCGRSPEPVDEAFGPPGSASAQSVWDITSVEHRLTAAGMHMSRSAQSVHQPFMSVPATRLQLGAHAELQVFIYSDEATRVRDTHALNPHHVAPPHTMITWTAPPTLITSANLAVILLTHDQATRDHVRHALANPPHPR